MSSLTMARSFSNLNARSVHLINAISKHGYTSLLQGFFATSARAGVASMSGKVANKLGEERVTAETESWVPDPITGYYRPKNIKEIDIAKLEFRYGICGYASPSGVDMEFITNLWI